MKLLTQPLARLLVLMGLMVLSASSFAQPNIPGLSSQPSQTYPTSCPQGSLQDKNMYGMPSSGCYASSGWYGSGKTFSPCPAGTYNGKTNQTTAAACQPASVGSYAQGTGNYQQTACPANSTTIATGQSSCVASPGYYVANNALLACPAGSTTTITGATKSTQCVNLAGYFGSVGSTTFPACPAGKRSVQGNSVCNSPSGSCSASFCD